MDDPVLTAATVEQATAPLRAAFRGRMERETESLLHEASLCVEGLIHRAYAEGLRDGFVQGATAQARANDSGMSVTAAD